jgi:hypothetical protein
MLITLWSVTTSTYICPLAGRQATTIATLQLVAATIDSLLAITVVELGLPLGQTTSPSRSKGPMIWASVLITVAAVWFTFGIAVYCAVPELRSWLLPLDLVFRIDFMGSQIAQALLLSALCISALSCVSFHFSLLFMNPWLGYSNTD